MEKKEKEAIKEYKREYFRNPYVRARGNLLWFYFLIIIILLGVITKTVLWYVLSVTVFSAITYLILIGYPDLKVRWTKKNSEREEKN